MPELLTSVLYSPCEFYLQDYHVRRLQAAAQFYNVTVPTEAAIDDALYRAISGQAYLSLKIRVVYTDGHLRTDTTIIERNANLLGPFRHGDCAGSRWQLTLDCQPFKSNLSLQHKITDRQDYDAAIKRSNTSYAQHQDVLLYNEAGEITETTIFNVIVKLDGRYVTPTLSSGLLDGVMRRYLLDKGFIQEACVKLEDLSELQDKTLWLCNAVRGVVEATLL